MEKATKRRKYKWGIVKKMVLGVTVLALITYGCSAVFIFFLSPFFTRFMPQWAFIAGTLSLGVIWSGILGFVAAKKLVRPLLTLEATALEAAGGNLTVEVVPAKSDDELRSLAEAFNRMIHSLRSMVGNIQENSRQTQEKVALLTNAAGESSEQAENIGRTIQEIAAGAERQAEACQSAVESIEEAARLAEAVNERAGYSKRLSEEMVKTLKESGAVVRSLVEGMHALSAANRQSIEAVQRLEKNAEEIGAISKVVGEIAEQTNLLALNASIEAARAGEHGRGFAVVAEEVRKLADESAGAVREINRVIEQMQKEVGEAVRQIRSQVEVAERESKRGEETTLALQHISKSVHDVVQSVGEIASLVEEQVQRMQAVTREAQDMAAVAEETSAGAQQVAAAAQQQSAAMQEVASSAQALRAQTERLHRFIEQFHV
ncbi:methyl-accepting chemotaxis protein [Bacillaceae bacterium]